MATITSHQLTATDAVGFVQSGAFDVQLGLAIGGYVATHYVAPFASVSGSSSDDDVQTPTDFANAVSSGSPCTIMCAVTNMGAGNNVQVAPGTYSSTATAISGEGWAPNWEVLNSGTISDQAVIYAQYPAAYYWNQPALLSKLEQTLYGSYTIADRTDPVIGTNADYVTIDGFYFNESETIASDGRGLIMIHGDPGATGCEVLRCWIDKTNVSFTEAGTNASSIQCRSTYNARVAGNRFTGNRAANVDNTATIEAYWSDSLIVENNYIDGCVGIWMKSENTHTAPHFINVQVRNNLVVNALHYALQCQTIHSCYVHNNILSGDRSIRLDARAGAAIEIPIWIYNNTLIGTNTLLEGVMTTKDPRFHNNETEIYNNIFVDGSTSGIGLDYRFPATTADDIGDMARYNNNVWYATSGNPEWNAPAGSQQHTTLGQWQTYCATFGTSPVYTSETYEAASSYSDPVFVSPDYTNVENGDWRLQDSGQDARTVGISGQTICGAYITGNEEIGLLTDMNGY